MTTKTTFHLNLSRRDAIRIWLLQRDPSSLIVPLGLALLCLLAALAIARQIVTTPSPIAARPTPALPIVMIATPRAEALPTPIPPHMVWAYASPGGAQFPDPIVAPAPHSWIGRFGDDWIEVDWTPNPVWIRAVDVGARLADVAPTPLPAEPRYQVTSEVLPSLPIVLSADEQAAVDREFGLTDADRQQALADHLARQAAIQGHLANEHAPAEYIPTSEDMPCNCP